MADFEPLDADEPQPLRVLLIDDDQLIADMYAIALRRSGYDVRVAAGGVAGLMQAREADFDLVLLDVAMPDVNGMDVLVRLQEETRTRMWPVVMFTNSDDLALRIKAHHLGARDYVVKSSVLPKDLPELVVRWVGTRDGTDGRRRDSG